MKGTAINTRPNMKVTDFFHKKPKTGPRPDQPIYDISSSSERQSIVSISSDDVPDPPNMSQPHKPVASERVKAQAAPSFRRQGSTQAKAHPPHPSGTRSTAEYISSSSSSLSQNRSREMQIVSKPTSEKPKTNAKKRKQPPINLLTSEESDGPVLPAIHVKPSSRKSQPPVATRPHPTVQNAPVSSLAVPLAPKQNTLSVARSSPLKRDIISTPVVVSQSGRPPTPKNHGPSPPKRARHHSVSVPDKWSSSAPDCDADDESDNEVNAPPKRESSKGISISQSQRLDGKSMVFDAESDPSLRLVLESEDVDDTEDERSGSPRQSNGNTTPREDRHEVLPSSQEDERELRMDVDELIKHIIQPLQEFVTPSKSFVSPSKSSTSSSKSLASPSKPFASPSKSSASSSKSLASQVKPPMASPFKSPAVSAPEPLVARLPGPLPASPSMPLAHPPSNPLAASPSNPSITSPSKSRANDIIARIKAKAKAEAEAAEAAKAQDARRRSIFGSEGSESDLSSLSSLSSDDDDSELELNLSVFGKSKVSPPDEITRRSMRHTDGPPPNYTKRLELFRDDTPPPSGQKSDKGKAKAVPTCPLDTLLKTHEREGARQAKAEAKCKALRARDFSPPPSDGYAGLHPEQFETPQRHRLSAETESPGNDMSSVMDGDVPVMDTLMGDAEREELLGEEGSRAVGKILESDRAKRSKGERTVKESFFFWGDNATGVEDVMPTFHAKESEPVLGRLGNLVNCGDYSIASLLLDSGILAAVEPTLPLVEWLFLTAMCSSVPALSQSAYRALLVLHYPSSGRRAHLPAATLLSALFKLGVDSALVELLEVDAPVVGVGPDMKVKVVCRFVNMVSALGRSQAIEHTAVPSLVCALLLLALDPSSVPELRQDIMCAIESVLASPSITRIVELSVCKRIIRVTAALSLIPKHEAQLLTFLQGCSPSAGRVRRWTAWAMLGGDLASIQGCEVVPPLDVLTHLFAKDGGGIRLEVNRETDYQLLGARVDVLSVVMTDMDAYARGPAVGALENICKALESLTGKIVDTRAAHLDRTRAKDAINRLHKRLVYQRHATLESLRGNGKLDAFVTKVKSRPKPVKVQSVDQ